MQAEQQQLWQGILQMSDKLKQLSDDQDWSAMIDLEARRNEKIQAFFASGISQADANEVAQGIRKILNNDSHLLGLAQKQQQTMHSSVQKITSSRQAIKAYGGFQK